MSTRPTMPASPLVALVTGASKGLGRAIAIALGGLGYRVVVNYRSDTAGAEQTVRTIEQAGGVARAMAADVTDESAVRGLVDSIAHDWGEVTIVVNNATGPQPMKALEDYRWQDFQDQLDCFVKAPVLLMQATLPAMKRLRWGRVIHIGSEVVRLGNAEFSAYVAAKAAMIGLTRSWASEFGRHGITVNCIEPGWIPVERHADIPIVAFENYRAGVPLGRQGVPEDVAQAVAFLAGEGAAFITGQCLAVNGGKTFG